MEQVDMKGSAKPKLGQKNWAGPQIYPLKSRAIRFLSNNYEKGAQIDFEGCSDEELPVRKMAQGLLGLAPENKSKLKSTKELIHDHYQIEENKYVVYSSQTENSSENELVPRFKDIDQMAEHLKGEPMKKIVYFVMKNTPDQFSIKMNRKAGYEKNIPMVFKVQSRKNIGLYSAQTVSTIKKFDLQLVAKDQPEGTKAHSREVAFGETYLLDLGISYDFQKNEKIPMNILEELIIYSVLSPQQIFEEEILKMARKHSSKILTQNMKIDQFTEEASKSPDERKNYMLLLSKILGEVKLGNIRENYYVGYLFTKCINGDYKPQCDTPQNFQILQKVVYYVLLDRIGPKELDSDLVEQLMLEAITQLSQCQHSEYIRQIIEFCIKNEDQLISNKIAFDTMQERLCDISNATSGEYILSSLMITYYYSQSVSSSSKSKLVNTFVANFKDKALSEDPHQYDKYIEEILKYENMIFEHTQFTLQGDLKTFLQLLKWYKTLKNHTVLHRLVQSETLVKKISNFISTIHSRSTDPNYLEAIKCIYITRYDPKLVQNRRQLQALTGEYIIANKKIKTSQDVVGKIFYQLLKSGQFELAQNIAGHMVTYLSKLVPQDAMKIINKDFSDSVLAQSKSSTIFRTLFFNCLVDGFYPESKTQQTLVADKWHNSFNYKKQINQLLLEHIVKCIETFYTAEIQRKNNQQKLKKIIRECVQNVEDRQNLEAIIYLDTLEINPSEVRRIIFKSHGMLAVLLKIKNKEDQRSEDLTSNLHDIQESIKEQQMSERELFHLLSLGQYEKNIIKNLFDDDKFFELLEGFSNQVEQYFDKIKQYIRFLNEIHRQFQTEDPTDIIAKLNQLQKRIRQKSLKRKKIRCQVEELEDLEENVLECYNFRPFFQGVDLSHNSIEDAVKNSNACLSQLLENLKTVQRKFIENNLQFHEIDYFVSQNLKPEQLEKIFSWVYQSQAEYKPIVQVCKIISETEKTVRKVKAINNVLNTFDEQTDAVIDYLLACQNIAKKNPDYNVCQLSESKKKFEDFLTDKKIPPAKEEIAIKGSSEKIKLRQKIIDTIDQCERIEGKIEQIVNLGSQIEKMKQFAEDQEDVSEIITVEQLEACEYVIDFLDRVRKDCRNFSEYVTKMKNFIKKTPDIDAKINSVRANLDAIQTLKVSLSDRCAGSKRFLDSVNQKILFQITKPRNGQPNYSVVLVEEEQKNMQESVQRKQPKNKSYSLTEITQEKEKAILLLGSLDVVKQKDRNMLQRKQGKVEDSPIVKNQINKFLAITHLIQKIVPIQNQMLSWGEFIFGEVKVYEIPIEKGDTTQITEHLNKRTAQLSRWKEQVEKIYDESFKAALLQGNKLQQFYDYLLQNEYQHIQFQNIATQEFYKKFKTDFPPIARRSHLNKENSFGCLQMIQKFFKMLDKHERQLNQKQPPAPDRDQNIVHLVVEPTGTEFSRGIAAIGKERLKNLKLNHLLPCSPQTSFDDLRSFIERALRDVDNEYVIMDCRVLDVKKQVYLIDRISEYRKRKDLKVKLCLIGDSQLQKLYEFMKEMKVHEKKGTPDEKAQLIRIYDETLKQRTKENVYIYISIYAGLGKTHSIQKHCIRSDKVPEYLPISGRVTEEYLQDKLKLIAQKRRNSAVLIQLYNLTTEKTVKIVNNFLMCMVMFRGFKSIQLPKETMVFIEIENVAEFDHFKKLPFLRELKVIPGVMKEIQKVTSININPLDSKLLYVAIYLRMLKAGTLETQTVRIYEEFAKVIPIIKEEQISELVNIYFWNEMNAKKQFPTYYQYNYFINLMFEACRNFSKSIFLMPDTLNDIFDNNMKKALGIGKIRTCFFEILVSNSRQFIMRTVPLNEGGEDLQRMSEVLEDFPFFIIPNKDGDSFSFIYKNPQSVDHTIKILILSQHNVGRQKLSVLNKQAANQLFKKLSLNSLQQNPKQFNKQVSETLQKVSGNLHYDVNSQPGYVINLDNFFKMCLIVQRMRQNIPMVIMGEAGVGKTALLKHVVTKVYQHKFEVVNVHAGFTREDLQRHVERIKEKAKAMEGDETSKLWVFFDEFNTTDQLGHIKELMMESRFCGQYQSIYEKLVIVAACNPYRKKKALPKDAPKAIPKEAKNEQEIMEERGNEGKQQNVGLQKDKMHRRLEKQNQLAFRVHPPPSSMVSCMWDYGRLGPKESEKYIKRMLSPINYKIAKVVQAILEVHGRIQKYIEISAVSLRDIQRFLMFYQWFTDNLPREPKRQLDKAINYESMEERAFIMSFIFNYLIRFSSDTHRQQVLQATEKLLQYPPNYMSQVKEFQQSDFYERLDVKRHAIAPNRALKQNIYTSFVCIMNKVPMIIVGSPGSSKSLSIKILAEKIMGAKSQDKYIKKFPKIRSILFQGSQTCTSENILTIFAKAQENRRKQKEKERKGQAFSIPLIVFDEIGLAEESPENPLKVLHPYLELERNSLQKQAKSCRQIAFIGISNWELDLSKMSRFLILNRPKTKINQLVDTAMSISESFIRQDQVGKVIVTNLSNAYRKFMNAWERMPVNDFVHFFGLRDFYSLIKCFWEIIKKNQIGITDSHRVEEAIEKSIFKNFNGRKESFEKFMEGYCEVQNINYNPRKRKQDITEVILDCLKSKTSRCPLVIVPDNNSVSFLQYKIRQYLQKQNRGNDFVYEEGSHFEEDQHNNSYIYRCIGSITTSVTEGNILILNRTNPSVQTALYDLFNKDYTVRGDQNICKVTMKSGLSSNKAVHPNFNCLMIVHEKDLPHADAPFLNRFQKYQFDLSKYEMKNTEEIMKKFIGFKRGILKAIENHSLPHSESHLYLNWEETSIKTLILKQKLRNPQLNDQKLFENVMRRAVMNTSQDFYMIYKFKLNQDAELPADTHKILSQTLQQKAQFDPLKSNMAIVFTTDFMLTQKQLSTDHNDQSVVKVDLLLLKAHQDLEDTLNNLYQNPNLSSLQIKMTPKLDSMKVDYIGSVIEKVKKGHKHKPEARVDEKSIFMIFNIDRTSGQKHDNTLSISYLNDYDQIHYEGSMNQLKAEDSKGFFDHISMRALFKCIENRMDFKYQNQGQIESIHPKFQNYRDVVLSQKNLLAEMTQRVIIKLEGMNLNFDPEDIKKVIEDKKTLKQCRNIRDALTLYLSRDKFSGAVSVFIKYLIDKEAFLTLNLPLSLTMMDDDIKNVNQLINYVRKQQCNVQPIFRQLFEERLQKVKQEYMDQKRTKRLPSEARKAKVTIKRVRLFPFSKAQCDFILNTQVKKNPTKLAKDYFSTKKEEAEKKAAFFKNFKEKSTFVYTAKDGQPIDLYNQIDGDQHLSFLLFLDLLIDFLALHNLKIKYCQQYIRLMGGFFKDRIFDKFGMRALVLLGFDKFWVTVFKFFEVFFDNEIQLKTADLISFQFREKQKIYKNIESYCVNLLSFAVGILMPDSNNIKFLKGQEQYYKIFTNAIFQLEELVKNFYPQGKQNQSLKLFTIRNFMLFLEKYDDENKFRLLSDFVQEKKQGNAMYAQILSYLDNLKKGSSEQKKKLISIYSANELFTEWFKCQPDNPYCLKNFLQLCDQDECFAHNSVNTLNFCLELVQLKEEIYTHPQNIDAHLEQNDFVGILRRIGTYCKQKSYQNNLSVLMSNVFMHQISQAFPKVEKGQFIEEFSHQFQVLYGQIEQNSGKHSIFQLFAFAFAKFYLLQYVECLHAGLQLEEMKRVDGLLSKDSQAVSRSFRLYCLKLLRRKMPTKQIHTNYILKRRAEWPLMMTTQLKEEQSKSFLVPKQGSVSGQLQQKLKQLEGSQGNGTETLPAIFEQASKSLENKHAVLNFFMRFLFSKAYTDTYHDKMKQAVEGQKAAFIQKIGAEQIALIGRYIDSKVTEHLQVPNQQLLNENFFVILNNLNWLFTVRKHRSPLTSLFFNENGELHKNLYEVMDSQFMICGVENPFINIAQGIIQQTRNNNIGVYLCGSECDYIYCHEDCGWPNDSVPCPMCGQKIGRDKASHSLSRADKGARRLISKKVVDGGTFYVWNMPKLQLYWEAQRMYIKSEINRMKKKTQTVVDKKTKKLVGFQLQNTGRTSNMTFKVVKNIIQSLFYTLISVQLITPQQCAKFFGGKSVAQATQDLYRQINEGMAQLKRLLNLDNKFYGWMYGIQKGFFQISIDFKGSIQHYRQKQMTQANQLAEKLQTQANDKGFDKKYKELYLDLAASLRNGLTTKQVNQIATVDASNAFNRDIYEILFEQKIKSCLHEQKTNFGIANQMIQGKMQFPFETVLLEDQLRTAEFPYSRILKVPQAPINLNDVRKQYEVIIREEYPYLDCLFNRIDSMERINDFYNVVGFVNKMMKAVQNKKTREDSKKMSIKDVIEEIESQQGNRISQQLKDPQKMINSWGRLAQSMGVLQNGCKVIGKMNEDYSVNTEFRAFVLDNSSKENVFGMVIGSFFYNFARSYNELVTILNARKNMIHEYKNLNLINEETKLHPQSISKSDLILISEQDLVDRLTASSINSIIYGQNVYFHNFSQMQDYFIKKLNGKCELIPDIEYQKSICYNGQAFSQNAESSNTITDVRDLGVELIPNQIVGQIKDKFEQLKKQAGEEQYEKQMIKMRGYLERIMILVKNMEGVTRVDDLRNFVQTYKVEIEVKTFRQNPISHIKIPQIVHLYQLIQDALRPYILRNIPQKYTGKLEQDKVSQLQQMLDQLPQDQDHLQFPTIRTFEEGLFRFVARNLQTGTFDAQGRLCQFLSARTDFWPVNFDEQKITYMSQNETFMNLTAQYSLHLLSIAEKIRSRHDQKM